MWEKGNGFLSVLERAYGEVKSTLKESKRR